VTLVVCLPRLVSPGLLLRRTSLPCPLAIDDQDRKQGGIHCRRMGSASPRTITGNDDIVTVQKILGHAAHSTTARYDRRPEEAKRKAAGTLHIPYRPRKRWTTARAFLVWHGMLSCSHIPQTISAHDIGRGKIRHRNPRQLCVDFQILPFRVFI
jgi:hypothetical protein